MPEDKKYTRLPVDEDHNCFACGPANPHGLHMSFMSNGEVVVSHLTVPEHRRGWNNMVHGGIISTILDEGMSWAAIHLALWTRRGRVWPWLAHSPRPTRTMRSGSGTCP